jgi:hypothetical protein
LVETDFIIELLLSEFITTSNQQLEFYTPVFLLGPSVVYVMVISLKNTQHHTTNNMTSTKVRKMLIGQKHTVYTQMHLF